MNKKHLVNFIYLKERVLKDAFQCQHSHSQSQTLFQIHFRTHFLNQTHFLIHSQKLDFRTGNQLQQSFNHYCVYSNCGIYYHYHISYFNINKGWKKQLIEEVEFEVMKNNNK